MTSRGCPVLLLAAVALLAACNGDDDTTASTRESAVSASTVAPTTEVTTTEVTTPPTAQSTTTAAQTTIVLTGPTTSAPTTTVAPSTAPTPTTNPSSSTSPTSDEERALAVIEGYYAVLRECARSIPTCDTSNFGDYLADEQRLISQQRIAEWQANSYEVVNGDSLTYEVLEVHLDFTIPYVLVCERDGSSLVERQPGEPDAVVEEGYFEKVREV